MIGLMDNIDFIKNINKDAERVLADILSEGVKKFGLKSKEKQILDNSLIPRNLDNSVVEFDHVNIDSDEYIKIVMVNGIFKPELSDSIPDYYNICSLSSSSEKKISKIADYSNHPIVAKNTANFKDGIYIESLTSCEKPVYLINYFSNDDKKAIVFPRIFVQCNQNSDMKIVEHNISSNVSDIFSNYVTEINCDNNSNLEYYVIQNPETKLYISGSMSLNIEDSGNAKVTSCTFGGLFVKNYISCNLSGKYSNLILDGIFLGKNMEYIDNDTIIRHNAPFSTSSEKYKGILDYKSEGNFNGLVYVAEGSHSIDSSQYNNNILLSESAKINSNPQLEIYCDDVKCAHGSTIGELEEDAVLYLRSRGISKDESRSILLNGFINEIVEKVSISSLKSNLMDQIRGWMQ